MLWKERYSSKQHGMEQQERKLSLMQVWMAIHKPNPALIHER
jgi:hypothetical protein